MLKRINLSAAYVLLSTIALSALASPTDALGPRRENFGGGWNGHVNVIKGSDSPIERRVSPATALQSRDGMYGGGQRWHVNGVKTNDSPNQRRATYGGSDGDNNNLETEGRPHRRSDAAVENVQNGSLPRFNKRTDEVPQKAGQGEDPDSTEDDDLDLSQNLAYNQTHVVRKGPEGEPQNQRGTLGSSINGFLHGFGTGLGAGSGINWQRGAVGGGWNAGIEKSGVGFGGGYTLTPHNFTFGQGSRFGPISINISCKWAEEHHNFSPLSREVNEADARRAMCRPACSQHHRRRRHSAALRYHFSCSSRLQEQSCPTQQR
ncbi:hypothetical protein IE81DRAFT_13714 [Ceraceosorus guamensis]|uniref:Uncharacterized protein n=1 Tax=Ceraceosorus guamensis TaxID=1522189 RepID=A0A316VTA6_9BASI|nr:hypothetical protein IE81DRAFT_13714 [Ceraceosorus guamensis]PWN39653.1 hypothetical protein IE81DRAFT_13714 [Ceraceosorus guamensis]